MDLSWRQQKYGYAYYPTTPLLQITPLPCKCYIIAEHCKAGPGGIELEQFCSAHQPDMSAHGSSALVLCSMHGSFHGSWIALPLCPHVLCLFAGPHHPMGHSWILNLCHGPGALNFADGWLPGPLLLPSLHNCLAQFSWVEARLLHKVLSTISLD